MKKRRTFSDGVPAIKYAMTLGGPSYTFDMATPDEEDYRSFLLDLRPFLLQQEPVYFERVSADLHRRLTDERMRDDCARNRADWKRTLSGPEVFDVNGRVYKAIDLFEMVAYSDLFHLDDSRRRELALLPRTLQDVARYNVYSFGLNAARVISPQANLISQALEADALDFTL